MHPYFKETVKMIRRIYTDVRPRRGAITMSEFNQKLKSDIFSNTEVEYDRTFDRNHVIDIALLMAVDSIKKETERKGLNIRFGLHHSPSRNYLGWKLVIEIGGRGANISQLLYQYIEWDKMESQDVLSFEDLMR